MYTIAVSPLALQSKFLVKLDLMFAKPRNHSQDLVTLTSLV